MLRVNIYFLVFLSFFATCTSTDRKVVLKKDDKERDEVIEYSGSRKYGNFINAVKKVDGIRTHYSLKINNTGVIQHILRYYDEANDDSLDYYRDLLFLVTDTSNASTPDGVNFFGYPISGYYSDSVLNNVVLNKDTKTSLAPLSDDEKKLFTEINLLALSKNIKFIQFDTTKVLGWFKYIF